METSPEEVTRLLDAWGQGDRGALDRLMPLVYRELHKMAKRYFFGQSPHNTLQTTAVINEAYLKLAAGGERHWANRSHFFSVAAKAMRQVLIDHARTSQAGKRGGEIRFVPLEPELNIHGDRSDELIRLDDALNALATLPARQGKVVELRYFAGLSVEEIAAILEISPETVMRDWKVARAFLYREMAHRPGVQEGPSDD